MLKYACAVIAAGVMIGCSSDKNITIGHPETVEPDKEFDVVLANFFIYGTGNELVSADVTRDSLRVVAGLPSNWQVLGASCYAAKDFNIATQLRGAQSIDTQALYDTLKTYVSKLQPMEADPGSEAAILNKEIKAHNQANKATITKNSADIKKWVAFKGAIDIKLIKDAKQDTILPLDTLVKIATLMGTDATSSANLIRSFNIDKIGFTIKPIIAVLRVKAPSAAVTSDTLFYYSKSISLNSPVDFLKQDIGDMTYVPISVAATPVKRNAAAMQPSNYTMQNNNGNIRIVFANSNNSQYAELFRANGSLAGKAVASHGMVQFDKHVLESSGSGFVKITNGSAVSVEKLSVVK
jgi:hypothetical protein